MRVTRLEFATIIIEARECKSNTLMLLLIDYVSIAGGKYFEALEG